MDLAQLRQELAENFGNFLTLDERLMGECAFLITMANVLKEPSW